MVRIPRGCESAMVWLAVFVTTIVASLRDAIAPAFLFRRFSLRSNPRLLSAIAPRSGSLPLSETSSSLLLGVPQLLPFPAVREIPPGPAVHAAEHRATHAPTDAVEYLNFVVCKDLGPIHPRHARLLPDNLPDQPLTSRRDMVNALSDPDKVNGTDSCLQIPAFFVRPKAREQPVKCSPNQTRTVPSTPGPRVSEPRRYISSNCLSGTNKTREILPPSSH